MKTSKRKIASIFVICVMLFTAIFSSGCIDEDKDARRLIINRAGINIPTEAKIVFHFYQNAFQDYIQYTAFEFDSQPTEWLKENSFSKDKNKDFEISFNSFFSGWIKEKVPNEYIPNFENNYFFLKANVNFLIYNPNNQNLIVYVTGF